MNIANQLFGNINIENKKHINGLTDELEAIFVSSFFDKNCILVTTSLLEANKYFQTLSLYNDNVLFFPKEDLLTSKYIGENEEFKTIRVCTLNDLTKKTTSNIIVTNLMGYISLLDSQEKYIKNTLKMKIGESYNREELIKKLVNNGYKRVSIVESTGEFAIRGYVLDVFSPEMSNPLRFEFFDDELEEIREFDPVTQKSISKHLNKSIIPFSELTEDDSTSTLKDYLENPFVFFKNQNMLKTEYEKIQEDLFALEEEHSKINKIKDFNDIFVNNEFDFLDIDDKEIFFDKKNVISFESSKIENFNENFEELREFINLNKKENKIIVLCAEDKFEMQKLLSIFDEKDYILTNLDDLKEGVINAVIFNVREGFAYNDYLFLNKENIFKNNITKNRYKNNYKYGKKIKSLESIKKEDHVVHSVYGIGIYKGIKVLEQKGIKKDFLEIIYRSNDKLYVPVEKIETLYKYSTSDLVKPKLSKLNGSEWNKKKINARKRTEGVAEKIFNMILLRKSMKGFAFLKDTEEQIVFENEFAFQLTKGQDEAIKKIKLEMEKSSPMDHLLCGDVGFGKTEVAFRAAFKAIYSSKQVLYICPTTILSSQHYTNALERFANFPVNIALLNRFTTKKEASSIIKKFKEGKIDFLIGTHRLLSKDVIPKDLGLLIIDEEQRFGVSHKEVIKEYKNSIDVLSLSATPIPRTLQMSLVGLKSLSILETPPKNRYPIATYVTEYSKYLLKNAILTELSRGGQVFILYNKVRNIESKVKEVSKLVKEAKITYAHGGMNKTELEDRMYSFVQKEYDVLVCTTIIETGIDIPNVNTLIIIDADKFGLSQLYQIRGRVGRSNKVAYAYLFYKENKILTENAVKRLKTLKEYTHLGSGFNIASRDLAIRGAGDILGNEQAGFIDDIGMDLYLKILKEEVEKKQGIYMDEEEVYTKPLLNVISHIDDKIAFEDNVKVEIHQLINSVKKFADIEKIKKILEDRFGRIDENLNIYMYECFFERKARKLGFERVEQKANKIEVYVPLKILEKIGVKNLFESLSISFEEVKFELNKNKVVLILDTNRLENHYIYILVDLILFIEEKYIV